MFLLNQKREQIEYYQEMLKSVGSLSRLFSEKNEPYIQYRIAENLFCKAFEAINRSRTDCSADASKGDLGIGIKTFLEKNGRTMEKVAEFNGDHNLFSGLDIEHKVLKIAELRNKRIETTQNMFGLKEIIYHCIIRKQNGILVYEAPMDFVNIGKIHKVEDRRNVLAFSDDLNEYSFNVSKSTLYKRFYTKNVALDFPVNVLDDPFEILEQMLRSLSRELSFAPIRELDHVFLPLYSTRGQGKTVPPKSGLNQWNARGRARSANEAYIGIPSWIHDSYQNFFPPKNESFVLILPNGKEMSAKVCQENSKALMSNPNAALGQWILRDVLNLKEGELLTYKRLQEVGLDSVVIYKRGDGKFDIDFTKVGSYEAFRDAENLEV